MCSKRIDMRAAHAKLLCRHYRAISTEYARNIRNCCRLAPRLNMKWSFRWLDGFSARASAVANWLLFCFAATFRCRLSTYLPAIGSWRFLNFHKTNKTINIPFSQSPFFVHFFFPVTITPVAPFFASFSLIYLFLARLYRISL